MRGSGRVDTPVSLDDGSGLKKFQRISIPAGTRWRTLTALLDRTGTPTEDFGNAVSMMQDYSEGLVEQGRFVMCMMGLTMNQRSEMNRLDRANLV